eukprot:757822-Hanusia_phi.AAC.3
MLPVTWSDVGSSSVQRGRGSVPKLAHFIYYYDNVTKPLHFCGIEAFLSKNPGDSSSALLCSALLCYPLLSSPPSLISYFTYSLLISSPHLSSLPLEMSLTRLCSQDHTVVVHVKNRQTFSDHFPVSSPRVQVRVINLTEDFHGTILETARHQILDLCDALRLAIIYKNGEPLLIAMDEGQVSGMDVRGGLGVSGLCEMETSDTMESAIFPRNGFLPVPSK